MRAVIGSKNPAKVGAASEVCEILSATVEGVSVPSDVSAQPITDDETRQGAINRAKNALEKCNSTLGIGLEGGIVDTESGMYLINWGALVDDAGTLITASGARILLPESIANSVRTGRELGVVMEEYTNVLDVRSNEGAVGIFTNGLVSRKEMFVHVMKLLIGQYMYSSRGRNY
jgi:inosine/xanthosine triphosphatase